MIVSHMRPNLTVVAILQILFAASLACVVLKASIKHQRTAELYSEQLRARQSLSNVTIPVSFVALARKEATDADKSFLAAGVLAFGIVVLAGIQVWLVFEARRDPKGTGE